MGEITNVTAKGDPMSVISVAGFYRFEEAFSYIENGYDPNGVPTPVFVDKNMGIGDSIQYDEDLFVVFSIPDNTATEDTLLSITRCHADVQHLYIFSYGTQMLLARTKKD